MRITSQIDKLTLFILKCEKNKARSFLEDIIQSSPNPDYAHALVSVLLCETRKQLCRESSGFYLDEKELLDALFLEEGQYSIEQIIARMCEEVKSSAKENKKRIFLKAVAYIDENLSDSTLSVGDAARYAGVSQGRLSKIFEKYKGTTPLEYIGRKRVEKSMIALKKSNASVKDIALSVGFSSAEGYIRAFKKQYSMPPGKWNKLFLSQMG